MFYAITQTGDHMSDTIELLEAIGRDASLRHASSEELTRVLQESKASDVLTTAVASGDSTVLSAEFGHNANQQPQASQTPGYDDDKTDQEQSDKSDAPSTPDNGKSPTDKPTK
jgi:hypothetical protein